MFEAKFKLEKDGNAYTCSKQTVLDCPDMRISITTNGELATITTMVVAETMEPIVADGWNTMKGIFTYPEGYENADET
eukprot:11498593-Ditylum_brightwellii.AAC.1